jgi:hypothetical protein
LRGAFFSGVFDESTTGGRHGDVRAGRNVHDRHLGPIAVVVAIVLPRLLRASAIFPLLIVGIASNRGAILAPIGRNLVGGSASVRFVPALIVPLVAISRWTLHLTYFADGSTSAGRRRGRERLSG